MQQNVTLSAAQDVDSVSSTARFSFSGTGLAAVTIDAQENDDDAPHAVTIGSAIATPGQSVPIDITVANPDLARIRSLSVTVGFDGAALGTPTMARGATVPGPASWNFGATTPSAGTQIIAGSQIAQPEGAVVDGVIATDTFTIPATTAPGRYDLVVVATDIGGRAANTSTAGAITVMAPSPPDGGPMGGGGGAAGGGGGTAGGGGAAAGGGGAAAGGGGAAAGCGGAAAGGGGGGTGVQPSCGCGSAWDGSWLAALALLLARKRQLGNAAR